MTPTHKDLLEKHLVSQVLTRMTDSNDTKLFDPSYAELVKEISEKTSLGGAGDDATSIGNQAEKDTKKPKIEPKRKAEPKPKVEIIAADAGEGEGSAGSGHARAALLKKIAEAAAS